MTESCVWQHKDLFPTWLNWDYVRDLFIMPNELTEEGTKAAAEEYFTYKSLYPYGNYINWAPVECGNLLSSDKIFVSLLYEWHGDRFTQWNRVVDADDYVTGNIYDFIGAERKTSSL